MKASELKEMTRPELEERLSELKEELFNLRFRMAAHQHLENPMEIRKVRREIARIHTILGEDASGRIRLPKADQ